MPGQTMRDLMTPDPTCCTAQTPIVEAARIMREEDCGAIPVVDNEQNRRLTGIITDRDIVCRIVAQRIDPQQATVGQAMSEDVASLGPEASIDECVRLMASYQVRRIPIVDQNCTVIGIVAQADLARASAGNEALEDELAEAVEEISEPSPRSRAM
ncbi:MAG: CBS domain-containing protein [Armatimonadota bacterium]